VFNLVVVKFCLQEGIKLRIYWWKFVRVCINCDTFFKWVCKCGHCDL